MAEASIGPRADARRGRLRTAGEVALGPLWRTTFRDPVREGRLRFRGLALVERHVARMTLAAVAVLLASAVLATTWRRGHLFPLSAGGATLFVPSGIVGVTLVGFLLAWVALTWGGLRGSAPVRLGLAAAYLLINSTFSIEAFFDIDSGRWILVHSRLVLELGFWTPSAVLGVAAVTTRWPRLDRWIVRAGRLLCGAAVTALFGGMIWAHAVLLDVGRDSAVPSLVSGALQDLGLLVAPLVVVSAVAVVDFALDVSTSLAAPAERLRARWVLVAVLGVALVKLWDQVVRQADYWRATLTHQPQAVARTALCMLVLAVVAYVVTRFRHSDDSLEAKEDLTFGGALVLTSPFTIQALLLTAGILVATHTSHDEALSWSSHFPANWLNNWGLLIISVLAVAAGVVLMRRSEGGMGDEIGSGLIVVGAWDAMALALSNSGLSLGFSYPTVDVVVTLAVLVVLLARWRRVDAPTLVVALTVLVFSWLVTSQGDYISFIGGLVGLSAVVVVVFGIVWTLLSGSSFTASSSGWMPQPARPLLFLGYILLSVAILTWDETTHASTQHSDSVSAYYFMAIPLGAWLLGRRVITRRDASAGGEPGALAEEVGDRVGTAEL
jgi:hypothetical protein